MSHIAYYRVSTKDQSTEAQRHALLKGLPHGCQFDKEYEDSGISGGTQAASRQGFSKLLEYMREGDSLHVYHIDRLGRDAIDVQTTVKQLLDKGVQIHVNGLGQISKGGGEIIVAVLAQVAAMERSRITERTEAGRAAARASLEATGKTHKGKESLGRPFAQDSQQVIQWKQANKASISKTAEHFGLSSSTIKRYMAGLKGANP